ncbi:fimbrial protein [Pseudomonas akapageensis]|uniref:fimbrial protein n=1 Tax=Pseudomonas akapageensis TaxID=2609961 RepID=UPI00140A46E6|nr:fimbrial protein [Pseudomonas akapageensis]
MKKFALGSLFAAMALGGASGAMAEDGQIDFRGSITATTCAIEIGNNTGGVAGEVYMGDVQASSLPSAGAVAGGGAFTLRPVPDAGCTPDGKRATVTFLPMTGAVGPSGQWLGIEGSTAQNVAIQFKDANGQEVKMSEPSADYDFANPIRFTVNYIATGPAQPGSANGKAAFSVNIR